MDGTPNPYAQLCTAIIRQAAEDYRELNAKGEDKIIHKDEGEYSKAEIEEFFRGNWCRTMLRGLGFRINGINLLRQLKSEKLN